MTNESKMRTIGRQFAVEMLLGIIVNNLTIQGLLQDDIILMLKEIDEHISISDFQISEVDFNAMRGGYADALDTIEHMALLAAENTNIRLQ